MSNREYSIILNGKIVKIIKERNETVHQFAYRTEIYIKALSEGCTIHKALMVSQLAVNKIKYNVVYKDLTEKQLRSL